MKMTNFPWKGGWETSATATGCAIKMMDKLQVKGDDRVVKRDMSKKLIKQKNIF